MNKTTLVRVVDRPTWDQFTAEIKQEFLACSLEVSTLILKLKLVQCGI